MGVLTYTVFRRFDAVTVLAALLRGLQLRREESEC
jgi:hypothetical protein|eukprot:COSAG01_NODE_5362_length_4309_cov_6.080266_2_plen_35_part_00